ncbi:MAG: hypothetical protein J6Y85_03905 [Alphaproteobacteria bacterium]|nr:hypothetical protein [Alphaproteobacteria bacterium]
MKKNIILLALSLTFATAAHAETTIPWTKEGCESVQGTWITAHSSTDSGCDAAHCNGKNFCRSNVKMNWFSALIWCHSIGRELTDLETACPNGLASGNTCANLKDKVPNINSRLRLPETKCTLLDTVDQEWLIIKKQISIMLYVNNSHSKQKNRPNGVSAGNTCANLNGKGLDNNRWFTTPSGEKQYVLGYSGTLMVTESRTSQNFALCTE